jgi:hypothetical protein
MLVSLLRAMLLFVGVTITLNPQPAFSQVVWNAPSFVSLDEMRALGNGRLVYDMFHEQKRLGNPALEHLTWEQFFPTQAKFIESKSFWVPEGHYVGEPKPEAIELYLAAHFGPIAFLGKFGALVAKQELLLNGFTEYEAGGMADGVDVLINAAAMGVSAARTRMVKFDVPEGFTPTPIATRAAGRTGGRTGRSFNPVMEALESRINPSGSAPVADYWRPWRQSPADIYSIVRSDALQTAKVGDKVGRGALTNVYKLEGVAGPRGEALVFRESAHQNNAMLAAKSLDEHFEAYKAGVYAIGPAVQVEGRTGNLDFYRGDSNWEQNMRRNIFPTYENLLSVGEQLHVAAHRNYALIDLHTGNLVGDYIVDLEAVYAHDVAFEMNLQKYHSIITNLRNKGSKEYYPPYGAAGVSVRPYLFP